VCGVEFVRKRTVVDLNGEERIEDKRNACSQGTMERCEEVRARLVDKWQRPSWNCVVRVPPAAAYGVSMFWCDNDDPDGKEQRAKKGVVET
jgi:hypothetical protein